MKVFGALVATGLTLAAASCGGDDGEQPPESRPAPQLVDTTVVEGGSSREAALLRRTVAGMEKTSLKRITIVPAANRRETDGKRAIAITFTPIQGVTTRRQWDEWIVAGAFSRRLLAAGLPAEVDGSDDRGAFTAKPKVKGKSDPRPLPDDQEAAIGKSIRSAMKKSGGKIVRFEVHHPYGVAVDLALAPADPASFLKTRLRPLLQTLDAQRPKLEGVYLAVLDDERRLLLEWGSWTRNPAGIYWVRHDLANCSPIRQSEPPGTKPPPECPA